MTDQAGARKPSNFPWIRNSEEDLDPGALGGMVMAFTAAVDLNVGDQVFLSAANTVDKSTTQADYAAATGVVMGGAAIDMYEVVPFNVGVPAAAANELVLVAWAGRVTVPAEGAISAGNIVGSSAATAGAVVTPSISGRTALAVTAASGSEVDIILPYL